MIVVLLFGGITYAIAWLVCIAAIVACILVALVLSPLIFLIWYLCVYVRHRRYLTKHVHNQTPVY